MDSFDTFKLYLPQYLSPPQQQALFDELKNFPSFRKFYVSLADPDLLQGDGWNGFVIRNIESGEGKSVPGLVLSNSCDLASANNRPLPGKVVFAPLIELSKYKTLLLKAGRTESQIESLFTEIKRQRVSTIFYLPDQSPLGSEMIALLDDVHSMTVQSFLAKEPRRLFTLSQAAFYVFLLKLSIHFTRLMEGFPRFEEAA